MKKIFAVIFILISIQTQAQLSASATRALVYKTADSLRKEMKALNASIITRLNNQNDDRIALTARVIELEEYVKKQSLLNEKFEADIKLLQLEDTLLFDTTSFVVVANKYIFYKYPFINERVNSLQVATDSLKLDMDRLKGPVKITPIQ